MVYEASSNPYKKLEPPNGCSSHFKTVFFPFFLKKKNYHLA
jgi:hypothetical protein